MSQAGEREPSSANAGGAVQSRPAWQQRLKAAFAPRPPRPGSTPSGGLRGGLKFMFGMLIFILGAQVIVYPIGLIDVALHLHLETIRFAPPKTPVLGGLTGLLLVWFAAILGLWWVLRRFDIIPKDPFGMQSAQSNRRPNQPQTTSLRSGPPRTRAERRHAAEAAMASSAKGSSKGTSKGSIGTRNVTTRQATVRNTNVRTTARKPAVAARAASAAGGDEAYALAQAADRARRRRATRR
jgi:hypothetical protein